MKVDAEVFMEHGRWAITLTGESWVISGIAEQCNNPRGLITEMTATHGKEGILVLKFKRYAKKVRLRPYTGKPRGRKKKISNNELETQSK